MTERERGAALVTGASAGIGAEFARQLAARGHDLVIVARDRARLEALAAELTAEHGITVEVLAADLLDPAQLASVEARVSQAESPVDYLVNNAGFGLRGEFDEMPIEDELRQFDLLARVPLVLTHAALTRMLPHRSGTIVTIASTAGLLPLGSYSAAKGWAILFSRWANAYYRPRGISVTAVAPGFVRTEFHERMSVDRESMAPNWLWLDVERVVREAMRDVDRGKALSVPSLRYKVLLGIGVALRPLVMVAVRDRGRRPRRR